MKTSQYRLSTLLILVTLVALCLWAFGRPGAVSIRSASGEVLVAYEDILSVDWPSQEYYISKEGMDRLAQSQAGLITPFQVCLNDEVIYTGNIVSHLSSLIPEGPVIFLDHHLVDYKEPIRIGKPFGGVDLRTERRIHTSLWVDGKLVKNGG